MEDAEKVISKKSVTKRAPKDQPNSAVAVVSSGGTVLRMISSGGSWITPSGVSFTKDRPYQFVPAEEIEPLLTSGRFRRAEPEEVQKFYDIEL